MRRLLVLLTLALALTPASAIASPEAIYEDCQDGQIDRRYAPRDLRAALAGIPADLDEYTNCSELIRRALRGGRDAGLAGAGTGSGAAGAGTPGGPAAGGPFLRRNDPATDPLIGATPQERDAVAKARAGAGFDPETTGARPAASRGGDIPAPLIALLILSGLAAAALAAPRATALARRLSPV